MTSLIPYPGKFNPRAPRPSASRSLNEAARLCDLLPLIEELDRHTEDRALIMFRDELRDTKEIAWSLEATEAAVANGIANARERAWGL